jgi:hypothetical protein
MNLESGLENLCAKTRIAAVSPHDMVSRNENITNAAGIFSRNRCLLKVKMVVAGASMVLHDLAHRIFMTRSIIGWAMI